MSLEVLKSLLNHNHEKITTPQITQKKDVKNFPNDCELALRKALIFIIVCTLNMTIKTIKWSHEIVTISKALRELYWVKKNNRENYLSWCYLKILPLHFEIFVSFWIEETLVTCGPQNGQIEIQFGWKRAGQSCGPKFEENQVQFF